MSGLQRGVLEPLSDTIEIPLQLESPPGRTYILLDGRHQVGRVGYRLDRHLVPVFTVGDSFAVDNGVWASSEEHWGRIPHKFVLIPPLSGEPN